MNFDEIKPYSHEMKINNDEKIHYLMKQSKLLSDYDTAIVCLHGNPSWSWYFRSLFQNDWRWKLISIDHLGMGLSSKVHRHVSIEEHAKNVAFVLNKLNIKKVHYVVHDWGGVISLLTAIKYGVEIQSIIGMNTSFFNKKSIPWRIYAVAKMPWSKFLNKKLGIFSYAATFMSTYLPLPNKVKNAYIYPYLHEDQRQGILNFLNEIPWNKNSRNALLLNECENFISNSNIPMKGIWGLRDFCFDEKYLNHWKMICPQLEIVQYPDAGHWCLEEKSSIINNEVEKFWNRL